MTRGIQRHRALAATLFILATLVSVVRTSRDAVIPEDPRAPHDGLIDFRDVHYLPAVAFLQGRNPYDVAAYVRDYPVGRPGLPYPPHSFLFHLPFAMFDQHVARVLHFALNVLLALALAFLSLRWCALPVNAANVFGLGALLVLSRPGAMTLFAGQSTFYIVTGVYAALLYVEARPVLAILGLVLTSIKPSVAAPLFVLMAGMGTYRVPFWGAALAGVCIIGASIPLAIAAGGGEALVHSAVASFQYFQRDHSVREALSVNRIDAAALLGRLLGRSVTAGESFITAACVLGLGVFSVFRLRGTYPQWRRDANVLACVTILIVTYHQAYDALLLAAPLLALATNHLTLVGNAALAGWRRVLLGLLTIPMVNVFGSHTFLNAAQPGPLVQWVLVSINSISCLAAFFLLVVAVYRGTRPGGAFAPSE